MHMLFYRKAENGAHAPLDRVRQGDRDRRKAMLTAIVDENPDVCFRNRSPRDRRAWNVPATANPSRPASYRGIGTIRNRAWFPTQQEPARAVPLHSHSGPPDPKAAGSCLQIGRLRICGNANPPVQVCTGNTRAIEVGRPETLRSGEACDLPSASGKHSRRAASTCDAVVGRPRARRLVTP